jgi:uncharacterized membrane protein
MHKYDSNILMIALLTITGILFILSQILTIPITSTVVILSFTLLFSLIVVLHAWKTLGTRELAVFFFIAYSIPLLYEYTDALGFGALVNCTPQYSTLLGPMLLGKVPYVIPLVWSILIYCSFTMTNIIFNRLRTTPKSGEAVSWQWLLKTIAMGIIAGLSMAALDLLIDPVMVAMGAWSWSSAGPYYGIPLWNYEGWIEITAVSFVLYSIYLLVIKKNQVYIGGEKRSMYTLFVVVLYLASLCIFGMYAVVEQVTYVIPWAVMTTGLFAAITVLQFSRSYSKARKEVL